MSLSDRTNIDNLDSLSSRHRTLQYEFERLQKASAAQITAQRRMDLEYSGLKSRVVELEKKIKFEEGKNRELREEVGRGRKAIEAVRIAAGHDTKKIQLKLDQANSKLTKIATDSALVNQPQGFAILNPISPSRSLPTVSGQAPLLEQSLKDLTEIRENMQEEIEAFRNVIVQTANNLREVIAVSTGDQEPPRLHQSHIFSTAPTLSSTLSSTHQIALSSYHPQIASERLSSLVAEIRSKMSEKIIRIHTPEGTDAVSPEEVEEGARKKREDEKAQQNLLDSLKDMEIELECSKAREMEARKGMEEIIRQQRQGSMDKAADKDQDANDLLDVMKEREKLEDERRRLMDALSSLSKERKLFDRERRSFLEEKRRVDVDDVLAQLPNTPSAPPPISSIEQIDLQLEYESISFNQRQTWEAHKPHSPSPLSPHKNRTPRNHIAKNKRQKTPLSRLVLEKAVRRKSLGLTVAVAGPSAEQKGDNRQALGEGSSRTNVVSGKIVDHGSKGKGKEKSETLGKSISGDLAMKEKTKSISVVQPKISEIKSISMEKSSLAVSQRVDLSKSTGIGPKGKGKAVWR